MLLALQLGALFWFRPDVAGMPLDDAWIHQVVARTFAETGTLGYAPHLHGAAATSYLWAILLAFNFKWVHVDPAAWALGLNVVASLVAGQAFFDLLLRDVPEFFGRRAWAVVSFAVTTLACLGANVLWFAHSGMEAMPFVALSIVAPWAMTHPSASRRTMILAGVAAALAALLRPEAMALGGLLVAHEIVVTRKVQRAPFVAGPWLLAVAAYVGSNVILTSHAMPATLRGRRWLWFQMSAGLSPLDLAADFADMWATRIARYTFDASNVVVSVGAALALYGALRILWRKNSGLRLVWAWGALHAVFYAVLLPTAGHGGRYQPLVPFLFVSAVALGSVFAASELVRLFSDSALSRVGALLAFAIVPWVFPALAAARTFRSANELAVQHIENTEATMGAFINGLPANLTVGSFDIGAQGFVAKRTLVDLGGLSDASAVELLEQGRIIEYLRARHIDVVVLPDDGENVLPNIGDYARLLHLRDNPAVRLERIHVVSTALDKWAPGIEATWNSARQQVAYRVTFVSAFEASARAAPADARRPIRDPDGLLSREDRVIAEHMLGVLEASGVAVDLLPTVRRVARRDAQGCEIAFGMWGTNIAGCNTVASDAVLTSIVHEYANPYLDAGDYSGATRALPHAVARAVRMTRTDFDPTLAPPPLPSHKHGDGKGGGTLPAILWTLVIVSVASYLRSRRARALEILRKITRSLKTSVEEPVS